jgi:putative addiction module component (TIGR02574 family)
MSRTEILEELRRMPEAERRELVEAIDLEFGEFDDALTLKEKAELDRRAEEFSKNPQDGIPWEEVRVKTQAQLAERRENPACVEESAE